MFQMHAQIVTMCDVHSTRLPPPPPLNGQSWIRHCIYD